LDTGVRVNVEPIISATLRVPQQIYDACSTEIDDLITHQLKTRGVDVETKPSPRGDFVVLTLKTEEMTELVKARTFLSDVVRGDVLECNHAPALAHFLTSHGRQKLRSMEKEAQAYISVDNRLRTLAIHGSVAAATKGQYL
jgi:hypothetical protein